MARIDIEVEDYLDEVRTKYLFNELRKRHDFKELIEEYYGENEPFDIIPEFNTSKQLLAYIKKLLKLREWHDKDKIIAEIEQL